MTIRRLPALTLAAAVAAGAAAAGDFSKFEAELRTAYSSYRIALFASNGGSAEGTVAAVDRFSAQWAGLMADWRSARPPQYADDAQWADTLAQIAGALDAAKKQAQAGELAAAHQTLEGVRDALWALHQRNGVEGFSDRVNAYHAAMEKVLVLDPALYTGRVAPEVVEAAGVLSYLAEEIAKHPAPEAADPDYGPLAAAFLTSVASFEAAARQGDPAAVKAAIDGLKPAYAKFFVKFG